MFLWNTMKTNEKNEKKKKVQLTRPNFIIINSIVIRGLFLIAIKVSQHLLSISILYHRGWASVCGQASVIDCALNSSGPERHSGSRPFQTHLWPTLLALLSSLGLHQRVPQGGRWGYTGNTDNPRKCLHLNLSKREGSSCRGLAMPGNALPKPGTEAYSSSHERFSIALDSSMGSDGAILGSLRDLTALRFTK